MKGKLDHRAERHTDRKRYVIAAVFAVEMNSRL
jgi:hypothetical protein